MGANYISFNTPIREKKDILSEFQQAQDQDRYENGHCYSGGIGMARGLKFLVSSFSSDQAADEWLVDHCQKWDAALAVVVQKNNQADHYRIGAWCAC